MNRPAVESQITFLYTHDLEKSREFYEELLGLTLWLDQGTCRIYQVSDKAYLGICQAGAGEAQSAPQNSSAKQGNVIFTIVTEQVDEWYIYLKSKGLEFEKAPALNQRYQIYNCLLRDPNGYLIEIQRFLHTHE